MNAEGRLSERLRLREMHPHYGGVNAGSGQKLLEALQQVAAEWVAASSMASRFEALYWPLYN